MSILRKGNVNEDVAEMQRALIAIDPKYKRLLRAHSTKPDDGIFGEDTKAAVQQYQNDHKLPATGEVDSKLFDRIRTEAVGISGKPEAPQTAKEKSHAAVSVPSNLARPEDLVAHLPIDKLERARAAAKKVPTPWQNPLIPEDIGLSIVNAAAREIDCHEKGRDNHGPDLDRYRTAARNKTNGSAWCADFVSYILQQTSPGLIKPHSAARGLANQFIPGKGHPKDAAGYHTQGDGYQPKPGDLVFFDSDKRTEAHVGIIKSVNAKGITTIEANVPDAKYNDREPLKWDVAAPDRVRERVWLPGDVKDGLRLSGFGSVTELAASKGLLAQTQNFAQSGQPNRPQRSGPG